MTASARVVIRADGRADYTAGFFAGHATGSRRSADVIVPLVMQLTEKPTNVVDFGCGVGTWLAAFRANGVDDVLGIDGDYVDRTQLQIPTADFSPRHLTP